MDDLRVTPGDRNIYYARLIADQQVSYVIKFADRLAVERLVDAMKQVAGALPILATVIDAEARGLRRRRVPGWQPALSIVERSADADREVLAFVSRPCDPLSEPPVKMLLVRAADADTLCVKADHVLTDAVGLGHLLALLALAYSDPGAPLAHNRNRGFGQILRRVPVPALVRAALRPTFPTPGPPPLAPAQGRSTPFIEGIALEPWEFGAMRRRAAKVGATVNDAVLTSIFRTVFAENPAARLAGDYPVMAPVDLRRYLPADRRRVVGNLASAVFPALSPVAGEAFEDMLVRAKARMDGIKRDHPGLGAFVLMNLAGLCGDAMLRRRYERVGAHGSRFICCTNIGAIPEACAAFAGAAVRALYVIGPRQAPPGALIAVSSFASTLHLVVQGEGDPETRASVRRFLDAIATELGSQSVRATMVDAASD